MDQIALVEPPLDLGRQVVEKLKAHSFPIDVAFWAKPEDDFQWYLYVSSSAVDQNGSIESYKLIDQVLREIPDGWGLWNGVRLLRTDDSITTAVRNVLTPRAPQTPFAVLPPRPYPGMTRFGGKNLGGLSVEGAIFYPYQVPTAGNLPV